MIATSNLMGEKSFQFSDIEHIISKTELLYQR